jgi:hypothetical protein
LSHERGGAGESLAEKKPAWTGRPALQFAEQLSGRANVTLYGRGEKSQLQCP